MITHECRAYSLNSSGSRLDTTIDGGASKLSRIQSEIGMLDSASKPSNAIKTETLLAGLGPEYEATLVGLDASSTADFEDTVSKLRKTEVKAERSRC
jgi:hypothetical protein